MVSGGNFGEVQEFPGEGGKMNKPRRILLVLVSLITVLAIVGVVSAESYDYTDTPLLHKAYEGHDDNIPPDIPPDFEAEMSPGNYTAISSSDDIRASYSFGFHEFHKFQFQIDEPVSSISRINVLHEGYASELIGGPGHSLYIWNYANPGWEFVATTNVMDSDQVLTGTFTSHISDYISGGYLYLLAITNSASSCPFLYTWDGTSYQFISDINSDGGIGYPAPTQEYALKQPHSEDYTKIDGSQLLPDDGTYRLEIAEDQNEIAYLDAVRLLAVDHSPDVEIYSPMTSWYYDVPPFEIHTIRNPVSPMWAIDGNGEDVLPLISQVDRESTEARHYLFDTITVDFGDLSGAGQIKLLYNAWIDWPGGPENAARYEYLASHPDEQAAYLSYVEVINEYGEWEKVSEGEHFGLAQAAPRTMVLDITDWFKTDDYRLRINNWYKTHVDYIAVDTSADEEVSVTELAPVSADLYWKGVSVQSSPDGKEPAIPDFYNTGDITGFSLYEGQFTRYGDVLPLLDQVDDKFVIMHVGDSISISFNELVVPEGMDRDYYLFSDGYYKENFVQQLLGQDVSSVEPLPFHAMSNYPYPESESYPYDAEHEAYLEEYNTREFRTPPTGESGHNSIYTDYVSVEITTQPPTAKYLHGEDGLFNLTEPVGTQWNELHPLFGRDYHLSSWEDNGDGVLSRCDTINLYEKPDGELRPYHVENVTLTLAVTPAPTGNNVTGYTAPPPQANKTPQLMYIELEGGYNSSVLINPYGTQWHEVYPVFCTTYSLTRWMDNDSDTIDWCDGILLVDKDTGEVTWWHVEEVAVDIVVTPEPPPVGGEAYPVSKASVLVPWIAVGVVVIGGAGSFILRRRRS